MVNSLQDRGVGLTVSPGSHRHDNTRRKLTFHIFAALAEFERDMIRERTTAGRSVEKAEKRPVAAAG